MLLGLARVMTEVDCEILDCRITCMLFKLITVYPIRLLCSLFE